MQIVTARVSWWKHLLPPRPRCLVSCYVQMPLVTVCVWQHLRMSPWRRFFSSWQLHILMKSSLSFVFFWDRTPFALPGAASCWLHCLFMSFTDYVQGSMSLNRHPGLGLFPKDWQLLLCLFSSLGSEGPSSSSLCPLSRLFFSPCIFRSSFSLLLHVFLQLIPTLSFLSNWYISYRVWRFCSRRVKDANAHSYSRVWHPPPETQNSMRCPTLVLTMYEA